MSSLSEPSRQRLIRVVRLLPGAVRVGRGTIEHINPESDMGEALLESETEIKDESPLEAAEAEIRMLKSELRGRESEIAQLRTELQNMRTKMNEDAAALEREREAFYASSKIQAEEQMRVASSQGYDEGHAKGYGDGLIKSEEMVRVEYESRFSAAAALLSSVNDSLEEARERLAVCHAPQLIRLWEVMLSRMLHHEVKHDKEVVERLLVYILKRVSDREKIIVCLNPADIAMIEGIKDNIMDSIRGVKFFELQADDHVECGSCLIETNLGIYDARWRTQLEQISGEIENLLMEGAVRDDAG